MRISSFLTGALILFLGLAGMASASMAAATATAAGAVFMATSIWPAVFPAAAAPSPQPIVLYVQREPEVRVVELDAGGFIVFERKNGRIATRFYRTTPRPKGASFNSTFG